MDSTLNQQQGNHHLSYIAAVSFHILFTLAPCICSSYYPFLAHNCLPSRVSAFQQTKLLQVLTISNSRILSQRSLGSHKENLFKLGHVLQHHLINLIGSDVHPLIIFFCWSSSAEINGIPQPERPDPHNRTAPKQSIQPSLVALPPPPCPPSPSISIIHIPTSPVLQSPPQMCCSGHRFCLGVGAR